VTAALCWRVADMPTQSVHMKKTLILAASALSLLGFAPEPAAAQDATTTAPASPTAPAMAGDPAAGLGAPGAGPMGSRRPAPEVRPDPCLRDQRVTDPWGNTTWQTVRVC
jgi:hypothetical protein